MFVQYSVFVRLTWKFTFWLTWPSLNINLSINTKIFQGFCLTYIEITSKILKVSEIQIQGNLLFLKKSWQMKICTQVNLIPLYTNLLCDSFISKVHQLCTKSKKIYRTCIIHCIFFIRKPFFTWASIFLI